MLQQAKERTITGGLRSWRPFLEGADNIRRVCADTAKSGLIDDQSLALQSNLDRPVLPRMCSVVFYTFTKTWQMLWISRHSLAKVLRMSRLSLFPTVATHLPSRSHPWCIPGVHWQAHVV